MEGALVGVAGPTLRWRSGIRSYTGATMTVDDRIELAALTKLFTAALVHRFADEGRIDLSGPLPPLASLPDFAYDLTGHSISDLLRDVYFVPLGLRETIHLPPSPAWPRGGTAGIETTLLDRLPAGQEVLRDHIGLPDAAFAAMTEIDPGARASDRGPSASAPAGSTTTGHPGSSASATAGATTLPAYAPAHNVTIAVDLVDSLGTTVGNDAVTRLFEMLEALAALTGARWVGNLHAVRLRRHSWGRFS